MKLLSKAAMSICQRALSVRSYFLKMTVATPWVYQKFVIWGANTINGMVGLAPGLTGATKSVAKSVAYTAGETVSCKSPSVLHPSFDWTDAAFEFNFKLTLEIFL